MNGPLVPRLAALALATGCVLFARTSPAAAPPVAMHHATARPATNGKPGAIHQEAVVAASPERVYAALLDSTQFGELTGMPAEIDASPGGAFHAFKGMIEGRNLELVPGRRIVQAWRVHDWPAGVYSIVRFVLTPEGDGTRVVLTHAGWEEGEPRASLEKGWTEHYMEPLKKHFAAAR